MSKDNNGNLERQFFEKVSDFHSDAHHLLEAKIEEDFIYWFNHLKSVDKRSLFLYLKKHNEELPSNRKIYCEKFFKKSISDK